MTKHDQKEAIRYDIIVAKGLNLIIENKYIKV